MEDGLSALLPFQRGIFLAFCHLPGHVQNKLPVVLVGLAEQTAKLVEKLCVLADISPLDIAYWKRSRYPYWP